MKNNLKGLYCHHYSLERGGGGWRRDRRGILSVTVQIPNHGEIVEGQISSLFAVKVCRIAIFTALHRVFEDAYKMSLSLNFKMNSFLFLANCLNFSKLFLNFC